jgi:hypothetical protein
MRGGHEGPDPVRVIIVLIIMAVILLFFLGAIHGWD